MMKSINLTHLKQGLVRPVSLAMMTVASLFLTHEHAQAAENTTNAPKQNKISVDIGVSNIDYSYKIEANSILTWRDITMLGIMVDYQSKRDFGVRVGIGKSLGYGYSTDDDIDNDVQGLSQRFAKAYQLTIGGYKNIAPNEKIGIDIAYTYLNNCKGGQSLISVDNRQDILNIADMYTQGCSFDHAIQKGQRYHVIQVKPYYEFCKKLLGNHKNSLNMVLAGTPIVYCARGYWCSRKSFVQFACGIGARAAITWNYKGKFHLAVYDDAAISCLGFEIWRDKLYGGTGPTNGCQRIKNAKNNILGVTMGITIPTRTR